MPTTARPVSIALSRLSLPSIDRAVARLRRWRRVARERRLLGLLDDRMLRDIGLAPDEARREAARPFWDARIF